VTWAEDKDVAGVVAAADEVVVAWEARRPVAPVATVSALVVDTEYVTKLVSPATGWPVPNAVPR
jgi:hypothetical protein